MPRGITLRELMFVEAFFGEANGDATLAATIAGYGKGQRSAEQCGRLLMLKSVHVKTAVAAKMTQAGLGATELRHRIREGIEFNAVRIWKPKLDPDGNETGEREIDWKYCERFGHLFNTITPGPKGTWIPEPIRKEVFLKLSADDLGFGGKDLPGTILKGMQGIADFLAIKSAEVASHKIPALEFSVHEPADAAPESMENQGSG